jgi:hypothetical protein
LIVGCGQATWQADLHRSLSGFAQAARRCVRYFFLSLRPYK